MDIRDQLRMLEKGRKKAAGAGKDRTSPGSRGTYTVMEDRCPVDSYHGVILLENLLRLDAGHLALAGKDESLAAFRPEKTVFLDLETTGLSGGAGTYAFLIGSVHLDGDSLSLRQYFLNDLEAEAEMLLEVHSFLSGFDGLVTYNGKTFDLPLLNTRFILQGISEGHRAAYHLDLLHTARRLWSMDLASCQLREVEKSLLGLERTGDVGGWEIPSIYFDYLKSGRKELLRPILTHNALDVKSLVALTIKAGHLVGEGLKGEIDKPGEKYALGRLMDDMNRPEQAARHLEGAADSLRGSHRHLALKRLSLIQKRKGMWPEAETIWQKMSREFPMDPFAYIELAKLYEHRFRDLEKALDLVTAALERLSSMDGRRTGSPGITAGLRDLERRLCRLTIKGKRLG
jgi:uncharacterized protein YprB with RNaseH-like and TPR domain